MIFGHIIFSDHAIERYRERILKHKNLDMEMDRKDVIKLILRDISYKNIKKIVNYGNYKFVFTRYNCEFRFERSHDNKSWVLLTVVRYKRLLPFEEPLHIEDLDEGNIVYGIHTAIKIREKKKREFEMRIAK